MTLIAAYIYKDTVQVIADSAVTEEGSSIVKSYNNTESFNSFGEIIQPNEKKIVIESAQKINTFNNSIVFTYSGLVSEGQKILEDLRINISINSETLVSEILSNYFQETKPSNTEYIVGFFENNRPKIFYYQGRVIFLTEQNSFIILGSGSQKDLLTVPLKAMLIQIAKNLPLPDIFLIILLSLTQCLALNALSFKDGIGGYFNGLYINNNGIFWVKDSCYLMYSSKNFEKGERFIVNKYNRDNVTCVMSPKIPISVYFPDLAWASITPKQWEEKWSVELLELNNNCKLYFYSWICFDRRIVNILSPSNAQFNNYIRFKKLDEIHMEFQMNDNLVKKLLTFPVNPDTGLEDTDGFGVTLNYL